MSKVSVSADSHLIDVCRYRFDVATLTVGSNDPIQMFGVVCGWLRGVDALQVSLSVFSHCFVIQMLDLHLYRSDLDSNSSTAGSNDLQATFWVVWEWLRAAHAFEVSRFGFMALADFSRYGFESSASTAPSNGSVRTLYESDGWPGRHW